MKKYDALPADSSQANRIRLALGIILLILAISSLLWEQHATSSGRWSWLYQLVSTNFGVYGWPAMEALLGAFFIAWSRKKPSNKSVK